MIKVVSVKFKNGGKPYYFAPNGNETYEKGTGVIVETAKGLEYATVVQPVCEVEDSEVVAPLKPVVRIANRRDEEQIKRNLERRGEAMAVAKEKIAARGLEMKLVDCEFAFDGSKVVFSFTAESRVDFRELIKDLSAAFHMRIELRQINIRDEIKLTGGLAPCGRECCCIGCMSEPKKVSVKMAKNQGLSLNPSKISGLCGRLMCCLAYEDGYYSEACKKVPKLGGTVETPNGKGTVVNVNMLKMLVKVKIEQNDSVSYHDFGVDEIRFMRGNVMMGPENLGEESDKNAEEAEEKAEIAEPETEQRAEPRNNDNRSDRRNKNDRRDRRDKNNGEKRENGGERRENNGNRDNRDNRRQKQSNGGKPQGNRQNGEGRENRDNRNNSKNNNNPNNGGSAEKNNNGKFNNKKRHGDKKRGGQNPAQGGGSAPKDGGNA